MEALRAQPEQGADVEPVIEILTEGLPGRANAAAEVPLCEHAVEVYLRGPQPAVDEFANVLAPPGFGVATDVDADQPSAGSTANDLTNLAYHFLSPKTEMRRRCGTRCRCSGLVLWMVQVKGRLTGVQHLLFP